MCLLFFTIFKRQIISSIVWTRYIEKKFNLQLFFLPTVSRTFILSWATTCYLPPCNACDIAACPDEYKAWTELNQANQVQTKINIVKGPQTCIIHLIPRSTCHWISNRMRYFLKTIFWSEHFPAITNCRSQHSQMFLVKPVLNFHKFPRIALPVSVR